MNVVDIFKDSLVYPSKNWGKLLILGLLMLIPAIFAVFPVLALLFGQFLGAAVLGIIAFVIILILYLIIYGYSLSITKETIAGSEEFPEFEWVKNLIDGIKLFIVSIVYGIIPAAVTLLLAYVTGVFESFSNIMSYTAASYGANMSTAASGTPTVPPELVANLWGSLAIVAIVGIILFILFGLLLNIAIARLAETDSFVAAFSFGEIFDDIGKIGWGDYIIWTILLIIIAFLFGILTGLVQMIPVIGSIIAALVIAPYILIFERRALGLIYNESKN